jgi:hypothetical protein
MRAKASLIIKSSVLTSEFISQLLTLEPDKSYDVGDAVSSKLYPDGPFRKEAFWSLKSRLPDSALLAQHLRNLVEMFDSRLEALRSIRLNSKQMFWCGLFGDSEMSAGFEIPADVIEWCSEVAEIAFDCFPCHSRIIDKEQRTVGEDQPADDDFVDASHDPIQPDLAFSYMAFSGMDSVSLAWPHETNGAPDDQILPRPNVTATSIVTSDLPESAEASQHIQRVLNLTRTLHANATTTNPDLSCLFATERAAGSIVRLAVPVLRQLEQLSASFRISVHQCPSVLRRLRELH